MNKFEQSYSNRVEWAYILHSFVLLLFEKTAISQDGPCLRIWSKRLFCSKWHGESENQIKFYYLYIRKLGKTSLRFDILGKFGYTPPHGYVPPRTGITPHPVEKWGVITVGVHISMQSTGGYNRIYLSPPSCLGVPYQNTRTFSI